MTIAETERLILRPFTLDDVADMTVVMGCPEVMRFSVSGPLSPEQTHDFIERTLEVYRTRGYGLWAIKNKSTNHVIGYCGNYFPVIDEIEEVELGYRLARAFWYQGLATEAARAAMTYSFESKKLVRLIAMIEPENRASINVAMKCGFKYEKASRFHDIPIKVFSINSNEYFRASESI